MDSAEYIRQLARLPKELAFPEAEYRRRVAAVRAEMGRAGLDALLLTFPPTLCYLAGYTTFATDKHACLLLPRTGDPVLQVASVDIPAAILPGWLDNIVAFDWHDSASVPAGIVSMIEGAGLSGGRIGVEFNRASLTQHLYSELVRRLPRARFEDTPAAVLKARLTKSAAEQDCLRKAAALTVAGVNASLAALAPGKTANEAAAAGFAAILAAGGEYFSSQPILAPGYKSGSIHATFQREILKAGDTVLLEYGGVYQRYTAPMARTAVIGEPSPAIRRVAAAVRDALNILIDRAKGGRPVAEVARAAQVAHRPVAEAFFAGVYGYSVGLGLPPTWNEQTFYLTEDNPDVLLPGMVFHLVPFLRIPGKFGVAISETILVTDTGCEVLTDVPAHPDRDLIVIPADRRRWACLF